MSPTQIRKSKKMRGLVQSGIPSSVRGKVWAYLAEYERFSVQPELFVVSIDVRDGSIIRTQD